MSSPMWATRFGISDGEFAELQTKLAGQDEPLRWCLLNGRIPLQEYLLWAMATYDLPIVRDTFFSIPADPIFWDAVKTQFAWSPSFFPLAEWQGVLLIGCLEAPRFHVPGQHAYRFVLASPEALEKRFREFEPTWSFANAPSREEPAKTAAVRSSATPAVAAPIVPAAAVAPAVAVAAKVRQRPADEVLADDLPPAPNVSLDDPDGLVVEIPPPSSPNLFVVPEGLSPSDIGQPVPAEPDGLAHDSVIMNVASLDFSLPLESQITQAPAAPQALPALPQEAPPTLPPERPGVTATTNNVASIVPHLPKVPPTLPPNLPPALPRETPSTLAKVTPMPLAPASAVTPPVLAHLVGRVSANEAAVALSSCTSYDALLNATIAHITTIFENGMVLNVVRHQLQPIKWSDLLLSAKGEKPDPISLELPSIFRVAFRTSLPYHGYVVPNPTNAAFFDSFTRGTIPKHVTVMPVLMNGKPHSLLMGLSSVDVDIKATLSAMEKLSAEFGVQLQRLQVKKAA